MSRLWGWSLLLAGLLFATAAPAQGEPSASDIGPVMEKPVDMSIPDYRDMLKEKDLDIVLIATDGILEVTSELRAKRGVEFGVETLETLVAEHADRPLPELAATILTTVRQYGRQLDDQTLLLVRRSAA